MIPPTVRLCCCANVQSAVSLLAPAVVHMEQYIVIRGQRPKLLKIHTHVRHCKPPLLDYPPLTMARVTKRAGPHKWLQQPPLPPRCLLKEKGDGTTLPQPLLLVSPRRPLRVSPPGLLAKRSRRPVMLLRSRRQGLSDAAMKDHPRVRGW